MKPQAPPGPSRPGTKEGTDEGPHRRVEKIFQIDFLARFRLCRLQSSKKKNVAKLFLLPIVAKEAPAVRCHFSSSSSRLALKFLKMKLDEGILSTRKSV